MEDVVGELLVGRGLTLGLAESLTGGLIGARLTAVAGASGWFRGGVVSYASDVKRGLLGVGEGRVVSAEAASAMAAGAARLLGADLGLSVTGVAGPTSQDDQPVGTVWVGLAGTSEEPLTRRLQLSGDRPRVREMTVIGALDWLRRTILGAAP
ncbi:MAG TPA: nicotinamide-nucleotide amidohydrolase family protein [Acidimicrobiales bacterium]|nr:nicotinamide-nucleotide amidohydrolase family protein [Acidimicrobiales bacterium]